MTLNHKSSEYRLESDGRFVITGYSQKRPFSSFLPGIAGFYGIPMWVFYVNRGQGIASFGTKNKDNAILEFFPANKAYQNVTTLGFRTFIKLIQNGSAVFYEPFKEDHAHACSGAAGHAADQKMEISAHELFVSETNKKLGLEISVRYFTVPGEPLAVLAREVVFSNISGRNLELELADGLPSVNPYGMNEFFVKQMSRTIEAWMIAENVFDKKAPFLRLKVDATDRPEVTAITEGNFYFSLLEERGGKMTLLDPVVDPSIIFGQRFDFSHPENFCKETPFKSFSRQITENKTPCAFSVAKFHLAAGKIKRVVSFFGQARSVELLNRYVSKAKKRGYLEEKRIENRRLINGIESHLFTVTSSGVFDQYCGQTYLDNIMRGGMPVRLGGKKEGPVFYVYSRKHGDLERDYNRFLVEPTYFSQGDGNYRDVNQNRRHDVWLDPKVKDTNIRTFLNLIQLDGFNPLVVKGVQFHFRASKEAKKTLAGFFGRKDLPAVEAFLKNPFNPGEFYHFLEEKKIISGKRFSGLVSELCPFLSREEKAEHGEGFWVDHWTYNLDLIESYLSIFPEDKERLIFRDPSYVFFDNDHTIRPRHEKYFVHHNEIRQYKAVSKDKEKSLLIQNRPREPFLARTRFGSGDIYKATLFVKLLSLFANKFASLDPEGIGIEMEADKPSWYDALNGLPGLLGSSVPETFELKRLALFIVHTIEDIEMNLNEKIVLPIELCEFVRALDRLARAYFKDKKPQRNFVFWDAASSAREKFRKITFFGVSGNEKKMPLAEIKSFLEHAREKIEIGLERALDEKTGMLPTYFENRVSDYSVSKQKNGNLIVKPKRFEQTVLPYFLETFVHALKVEQDPSRRKALLKAVRESGLYDRKLGMYRVNTSLRNAPLEIGRACVFAPGWLENESIWLHMEYKWMLEILKSGMAEEFFKDFKNALVPFQPADRYGRSILENSSFIVSSAFLDASLHGAGFVARLSGSTAEFVNMWLVMNIGKRPFIVGHDKKLSLRFEPTLPEFLFTVKETDRVFTDSDGEEQKVKIPKDCLAFLFLGKTLVVYHNPRRLDTFGKQRVAVKKISFKSPRGEPVEFKGDTVPSPYAAKIRDEFVARIDIELG